MHYGIFSADQHLQANQYNIPEREADYIRAFENTANHIIETENVGFGAFLGDIIDLKVENRATTLQTLKTFSKITQAGKTVYTLRGNHDIEIIPIAKVLNDPKIIDAQEAYQTAINQGKAFTPYGEDGPRVCAIGFQQYQVILETIQKFREIEKLNNVKPATEIWLHAAIKPGAPEIGNALDAQTFHALGYHTIVAGDIHNGGLWTLPNGILIYPGSKEMTDISENPETKGEYLHKPDSAEEKPNPNNWIHIPYTLGRPYRQFIYPNGISEKHILEITQWAKTVTEQSGLKPIIEVQTKTLDIDIVKQSEIKKLTLRLHTKKPKQQKEQNQNQETNKNRLQFIGKSFEECLLTIAEQKNLKKKTLIILNKTLIPNSK